MKYHFFLYQKTLKRRFVKLVTFKLKKKSITINRNTWRVSYDGNKSYIFLLIIFLLCCFRWRLEVKTYSRHGVLLYNSGLNSRSDFVAVELIDGRVRLLIDKGNGPAELQTEASVADGRWHSLVVQVGLHK